MKPIAEGQKLGDIDSLCQTCLNGHDSHHSEAILVIGVEMVSSFSFLPEKKSLGSEIVEQLYCISLVSRCNGTTEPGNRCMLMKDVRLRIGFVDPRPY